VTLPIRLEIDTVSSYKRIKTPWETHLKPFQCLKQKKAKKNLAIVQPNHNTSNTTWSRGRMLMRIKSWHWSHLPLLETLWQMQSGLPVLRAIGP